jgi:hypothetical protein
MDTIMEHCGGTVHDMLHHLAHLDDPTTMWAFPISMGIGRMFAHGTLFFRLHRASTDTNYIKVNFLVKPEK